MIVSPQKKPSQQLPESFKVPAVAFSGILKTWTQSCTVFKECHTVFFFIICGFLANGQK